MHISVLRIIDDMQLICGTIIQNIMITKTLFNKTKSKKMHFLKQTSLYFIKNYE